MSARARRARAPGPRLRLQARTRRPVPDERELQVEAAGEPGSGRDERVEILFLRKSPYVEDVPRRAGAAARGGETGGIDAVRDQMDLGRPHPAGDVGAKLWCCHDHRVCRTEAERLDRAAQCAGPARACEPPVPEAIGRHERDAEPPLRDYRRHRARDLEDSEDRASAELARVPERHHEAVCPRVPAAPRQEAHACGEVAIGRIGVERLGEVAEVHDLAEGGRLGRKVAVDQPCVLARLRELAEAAPDRGKEPENHQPRALAYAARSRSTLSPAPNRSVRWWRAPQASEVRSASSRSNDAMARASSAGACRSTRRPVFPSITSSGVPPTRVATTGRPAAIASRITRLSASGITDGTTTTSASG